MENDDFREELSNGNLETENGMGYTELKEESTMGAQTTWAGIPAGKEKKKSKQDRT